VGGRRGGETGAAVRELAGECGMSGSKAGVGGARKLLLLFACAFSAGFSSAFSVPLCSRRRPPARRRADNMQTGDLWRYYLNEGSQSLREGQECASRNAGQQGVQRLGFCAGAASGKALTWDGRRDLDRVRSGVVD